MGKAVKYLIGICICFVAGAISVLWLQAIKAETDKREGEVASVKWRQNHFMLSIDNLYNELVAQSIDYPEIVLGQAVLETGHFQSFACNTRNNLFGLRNGDGSYMSFPHWTYAVAAYKKYIQKYDQPPNNYYMYLDKLGYAEDPDYTDKLKNVVKSIQTKKQ